MKDLGLIIIQLLLRREFEPKEFTRYYNTVIIDDDEKKKKNDKYKQHDDSSSSLHDDEYSLEESVDSSDFFGQKKKQKAAAPSNFKKRIYSYDQMKEYERNRLHQLKEKVSKSIQINNNSHINILFFEEFEQELPVVSTVHTLLKDLIKLCFYPIYPLHGSEGGSHLRLDIFPKYKVILENLRKVSLSPYVQIACYLYSCFQ